MFCTQCGKQIPDDSLFCVHCGKKVMSAHRKLEEQKAQAAKPASVPQKPKKKKAVWPWILILVLLIIAGLTAGVVLNRERIAAFLMGDSEPQNEEHIVSEAESLEETLETETEKTANVEEEIAKIKEIYYSTVEDISAGKYIQRSLRMVCAFFVA